MTAGQPDPAGGPDTGGGPSAPTCSAKGCRAGAVWVLVWNNPKVHTPDRRKTWAACDAHRPTLSAFLEARAFLQDVVALTDWDQQPPPHS